MEFTQESIDALALDEAKIIEKIANELHIRALQAASVINLIKEGCTVPFIARYRKEAHGSLDEVHVRDCDHKFTSYKNLEERRLEIIKGIFAQGKLTDSLYEAVMNAATLAALEDLWAPFKKKKKTRGMMAVEKGLEALAECMLVLNDTALEEKAKEFIKIDEEHPELSVATTEDALSGAKDIIAERVSQDSANREAVLALYRETGSIRTKGIGDEETAKTSVYQMYWDYSEPLKSVKPHRILAINRGERETALDVTLDVDVEQAVALLKKRATLNNRYHAEAIEDGVVRLLSPSVVREIRSDESDKADEHGIGIFSENLRNLLMTQPIKESRVLGVDPGIRTGTKCAVLDETGKYLASFLIKQVSDAEGSYNALKDAIKTYNVQIVAVGNGTGSQEVQQIVSRVISENFPDVRYTVVDESGASVYSASDIAREEFPDLDLTIRGAISMGRRLQDPLAELVKIDPKAIGVGLYQHDVNQKKLSDTLDEVVSSVVNNVGVNLNTASASLLKYVSGITSGTAKKIVAYRDANGKITSREDLKKVNGLGPKAFEQCAGFLKIPESADELDNTWVHPENYEAARELLKVIKSGGTVSAQLKSKLKEKYHVGDTTLSDIIEELKKPNRDPREHCPAPIMQQGVLTFEDLKPGMKVTGKIKNVVDFGAFVDVGLHETALIHISELSDSFVKEAMEHVKVGDVKEFTILALDADRKRISLSLKSDAAFRATGDTTLRGTQPAERSDKSAGVRTASGTYMARKQTRVVAKKGAAPAGEAYADAKEARVDRAGHGDSRGNAIHAGAKRPDAKARTSREPRRNDTQSALRRNEQHGDGMTYNPFADLLKK
ncbi:MAG: RNA-binding transcriptional accessory protein [Treponema sp.]|nr:RNA-binding transcriptional accessory protein [Treponema sp.]